MGQLITGRYLTVKLLSVVSCPNVGTLFRNGTTVSGEVVFGAVDPGRSRSILELHSVLGVKEDEELSFEWLRDLDYEQRRRRKSALRQKRTAVADDEGPRDMG